MCFSTDLSLALVGLKFVPRLEHLTYEIVIIA